MGKEEIRDQEVGKEGVRNQEIRRKESGDIRLR